LNCRIPVHDRRLVNRGLVPFIHDGGNFTRKHVTFQLP
jgi:hypothetical protein